jgi:uncharacterized protein (DUF305 family)
MTNHFIPALRSWVTVLFEMKKYLLLIGSALVVSTASAQMSGMGNMRMDRSMAALNSASGKTFDIYWMSQMIEHHKGAVDMARAALKDGKDARVKKAAQSIVSTQGTEIRQLETWLQRWYGVKPDAKQMALMRADMEPMMNMSTGGMAGMVHGDPDKNFLEAMIPHHQSAVDMSKLALKKAAKPELKVFAQKVINDQTAEIKQFQAWLKTMK